MLEPCPTSKPWCINFTAQWMLNNIRWGLWSGHGRRGGSDLTKLWQWVGGGLPNKGCGVPKRSPNHSPYSKQIYLISYTMKFTYLLFMLWTERRTYESSWTLTPPPPPPPPPWWQALGTHPVDWQGYSAQECGGEVGAVNVDSHPFCFISQLEKERRMLQQLEEVTLELQPLEKIKTELDQRASQRANLCVWGGLGFMALQFGLLARLTWWEYSWDIMEPVTYFVGTGTAMVAYAYFVLTRQVSQNRSNCRTIGPSYRPIVIRANLLFLWWRSNAQNVSQNNSSQCLINISATRSFDWYKPRSFKSDILTISGYLVCFITFFI